MGIVTVGLLDRAAQLISPDLTYIGVGTGTAIDENSTLLDDELTRKEVVTFVDANTIVKEVFFDTGEANGVLLTTLGLFGNGATINPNTGALMFGDNVSLTKDNTESLTVSMEITINKV